MEKSALNCQVGGTHYKHLKYQPITFMQDVSLNVALSYALKYVARYPLKNKDDLDKAIHCLEIFQEYILEKETVYLAPITFNLVYEFSKQFSGQQMKAIQAILACQNLEIFNYGGAEFDPSLLNKLVNEAIQEIEELKNENRI